MSTRRATLTLPQGASRKAKRPVEVRAETARRESDAALKGMSENIQRNRDRFTVSAVNKAFAKFRTAKVG